MLTVLVWLGPIETADVAVRPFPFFIDLLFSNIKIPFIALVIINQWVLPFGLWLIMLHRSLFKAVDRFICPICGEEKKGLVEHIRGKHGEQWLNVLKLHHSSKS